MGNTLHTRCSNAYAPPRFRSGNLDSPRHPMRFRNLRTRTSFCGKHGLSVRRSWIRRVGQIRTPNCASRKTSLAATSRLPINLYLEGPGGRTRHVRPFRRLSATSWKRRLCCRIRHALRCFPPFRQRLQLDSVIIHFRKETPVRQAYFTNRLICFDVVRRYLSKLGIIAS